jgi:FkbM family methyltransferase
LTPSLASQLRQFVALTADLGVADGARLLLRELGVGTLQSMAYPGLDRRYEVLFDPVWRWIGRGIREQGFLRFAADRVGKGSTVFDVGAHLGESALLFSELVGPSGKVVAFEPDPVACRSLRTNLELNAITNVRAEEMSVSDRAGKILLATDRFGSGRATIVRPRARGARLKEVDVDSTTLDQYSESHGLSPDWIKIDAEGAESLVVDGMPRLIEESHPSVILEFHSDSLTDEERSRAWSNITARASSVLVLDSLPVTHAYLEELPREAVPDRGFLIVCVKY